MKIYGHRGAAGEAPENTIAGCLHALERGAECLEVDLRISADDQLVVVHDASTTRTTGYRMQVSEYTAAELQALDARHSSPPWPDSHNCHIPTLTELLEATPSCESYFLEIKDTARQDGELLIELLKAQFPSESDSRKIVVTANNRTFLENLKEELPYLQTGWLGFNLEIFWRNDEFPFEHVLLSHAMCNYFLIKRLKKMGFVTSAWTVNDPLTIRNLYRLKVDSLITDYPSMAVPLVGKLVKGISDNVEDD